MSVGSQTRGISAQAGEIAYRPVSKAAALELTFAIVSLLAFSSPAAWILPVAVLIFAVRTSSWLERAKGEYAGQVLAKLAIFISLVAAVGAPTKHFVERYVILNEAMDSCNAFLDLVLANQVKDAFKYTLSPLQKSGMEDKIDELIVRAGQNYREYLNWDAIIKLRGRLQTAQVTYLGLASKNQPGVDTTLSERVQDWVEGSNFVYSNGTYQAALRYRITLDDGSVFEAVAILVGGTGDWKGRQWFVSRIDIKAVL